MPREQKRDDADTSAWRRAQVHKSHTATSAHELGAQCRACATHRPISNAFSQRASRFHPSPPSDARDCRPNKIAREPTSLADRFPPPTDSRVLGICDISGGSGNSAFAARQRGLELRRRIHSMYRSPDPSTWRRASHMRVRSSPHKPRRDSSRSNGVRRILICAGELSEAPTPCCAVRNAPDTSGGVMPLGGHGCAEIYREDSMPLLCALAGRSQTARLRQAKPAAAECREKVHAPRYWSRPIRPKLWYRGLCHI